MRTRDWLASLLASVLAGALAAGCHGREEHVPGDAGAGRAAIERHQCGACHEIPGVAGASGKVGPPLTAYRKRVYLAGKFPQDQESLARWIRDAPSMEPRTAMPATGLTEAEARDIAAYLLQLR